ncbi:MAG: hypothetical protein KAI47_06570, partial [Deltaproteobacteria bacterium]|nr:hypothetical protein [Deltaproteobacteria bacterium]
MPLEPSSELPQLTKLLDGFRVDTAPTTDAAWRIFLLASSSVEPALLQQAEAFGANGHNPESNSRGVKLFIGLAPAGQGKRDEDLSEALSEHSEKHPDLDDRWLTRNSDLVVCELAHALGTRWRELPALAIVDHLDFDSRPNGCTPTSSERLLDQLHTLQIIPPTRPGENTEGLNKILQTLPDARRVWVDPRRLTTLLTTLDLGRQASWLEHQRRTLGRGLREAREAELQTKRRTGRQAFAQHLAAQLTEARHALSLDTSDAATRDEALLRDTAERLAPLALVGERLVDLPTVHLPRGLHHTTRRLLETALRVGALLEMTQRKDPALALDPGVPAACAWAALERELNASWFQILPGDWCPLDRTLERASGIHGTSIVSALDNRGAPPPRREHLDALDRIITGRRAYLAN